MSEEMKEELQENETVEAAVEAPTEESAAEESTEITLTMQTHGTGLSNIWRIRQSFPLK